jgi:hypothetical protein
VHQLGPGVANRLVAGSGHRRYVDHHKRHNSRCYAAPKPRRFGASPPAPLSRLWTHHDPRRLRPEGRTRTGPTGLSGWPMLTIRPGAQGHAPCRHAGVRMNRHGRERSGSRRAAGHSLSACARPALPVASPHPERERGSWTCLASGLSEGGS